MTSRQRIQIEKLHHSIYGYHKSKYQEPSAETIYELKKALDRVGFEIPK